MPLAKRITLCWGVAGITTLLLFGCATRTSKDPQPSQMDERVGVLYSQQKHLASKLERLENSLLVMQDQLEVTRSSLRKDNQATKRTKSTKRKVKASKRLPPPPSSRTSAASAGGERAFYQEALALYDKGEYDDALVEFEHFVKKHPSHDLADNAVYWMGEIFYSQREFALAVQEFRRVLRDFPSGNKVPDALVKMALSFDRLGQKKQSHKLMEQVLEQHQGSRAYRIARDYLDKSGARENAKQKSSG